MISPYSLLQETGFAQYTAMVRFTYDRENTSLGAEKLAEMVRAIPGSTRVTTVSLDKDKGIAIFNVKLISAKTPKKAFVAFKQNALTKFKGMLLSVEIGAGTIEKKGDFILSEARPQTNLSQYLGQLLEEGLLLEVSIEELRRQFVECDPPKLTAEVFDQIVQACNNKSNYATWLCKKIADNIINTEDLQLWSAVFEFFDRYKQRFQKKDINQVKTREDITDFLTDYNNVKDAIEAKKSTGLTQKVKDETDQCFLGHLTSEDGQKWLVYKTNPGQWELERKIGSGTSWCTVAQKHYFDLYMHDYNDPAYYIFINAKNPKEKYQIHYGSNQCKDRNDHEVDYADQFVQDFYRYLEKVDNRTKWPRNAVAGREKQENRKQLAKKLDEEPNRLDSLSSKKLDEGTVYLLPPVQDTLIVATIFRDLGIKNLDAVKFAESAASDRDQCIIKPNKGEWDITFNSYGGYLDSLKSTDDRYNKLPLATFDNITLYQFAAERLNARIPAAVLIRCDKNLPDLNTFKVKTEGNRTVYKLPNGQENPKVIRAYIQSGMSQYYVDHPINKEVYVYEGPEVPTRSKAYVFTSIASNITGRPDTNDLETRLNIYKLAGLDLNNISGDPGVYRYNAVGGIKGIKEDIESSKEKVEGIPDEFSTGKSKKLPTLLGYPTTETIPFLYKGESPKKAIISIRGAMYTWSIEQPDHILGVVSQKDFINMSKEIPLQYIVRFCQAYSIEIPVNLEKLYARSRGIAVNSYNVTRILRQQVDHLRNYELPYRKNIYGRTLSFIANGVYGSWDQLGPAIKESSPTYYPRLRQMISAHNGCTADVLVYYHNDIHSRPWNALIRVINQEGKVVAYAQRSGGNYNLDWRFEENIHPDRQADAGTTPESNYVAPQPAEPRQRQVRQARAEAPAAAPAPEVAPEQQQQLEQYRQNIQAAQNVYRIPTNQRNLIAALGFTNLAANVEGLQGTVIVYDAVAHRGSVSRVALANIQEQNVVILSLPGNQTLGAARQSSGAWRLITHCLDNSVRTFQQCVDVCNQTHTPLPVGLQAWLVYRGQGQAQVAPNA